MSRLAELLAELSDLLSTAVEKEQLCSSPTDSAATIMLNRAAHFATPDGSSIKLSPGDYRVGVLAEGHSLLSSASERRSWIVEASRTWHELKVASPLALSVPVGEDEENPPAVVGRAQVTASKPPRLRVLRRSRSNYLPHNGLRIDPTGGQYMTVDVSGSTSEEAWRPLRRRQIEHCEFEGDVYAARRFVTIWEVWKWKR